MASDDRCAIEKQSTANVPSSLGLVWVDGRENLGIVLGAVVFALTIAICFALILYLRSKGCFLPQQQQQQQQSDDRTSIPSYSASPTSSLIVPFVMLHDRRGIANANDSYRKPVGQILRSVLENYQKESSQALAGLSAMLDEALTSEETGEFFRTKKSAKFLSTKIERRIQRTATCVEHDERILSQLLGNFSYFLALPDKESTLARDVSEKSTTDDGAKEDNPRTGRTDTNFRLPHRNKDVVNEAETHSYDSATQIWAHIVRDWTVEGRAIRHVLYDWCYQQMDVFCRRSPQKTTVLVPGAGMGRLAYDLYQRGYHVEANELSPSMAAAAFSVLGNQIRGSFHPYVLDSMANEVNSERRFDSVRFPDVPIQAIESSDEGHSRGTLSYTVGDFVGSDDYYYRKQRVGQFDAIVSFIGISQTAL